MADDVNIRVKVDTSNAQTNTDNYKRKAKELKDQLTALQIETNGLSKATAEQIEQYNRLSEELGTIQDAMSDAAARAKWMADDFHSINTAMDAMKGGIGIFQGLTGAADMLGISNEGALKVIEKMQAAQGVLNGINAVQQMFNKDSTVMIGLRVAKEKLLQKEITKTALAEKSATAATATLTAGEGVATAGAGTLTVALKAVGAAIKAIPVIGWILAAVAALTTLVSLIVAANSEESEGERLQREKEQNQQAINDAYIEGEKAVAKETRALEKSLSVLDSCTDGTDEWQHAAADVANTLGVSVEWLKKNKDKVNELALAWLNVKKVQATQDKLLENMAANDVKLLQLDVAKAEMMAASVDTRRGVAERWAEIFGWSEKQVDELVDAVNKTRTKNETDYRRAVNRIDAVINQSKSSIKTANAAFEKEYNKLGNSIKSDLKTVDDAHTENAEIVKKTNTEKSKSTKQQTNDEREAAAEQKRIEDGKKQVLNNTLNAVKEHNKNIKAENDKTHEGRLANIETEYNETVSSLEKQLADAREFYGVETDEYKAFAAVVEQLRNDAQTKRDNARKDELKAEKDKRDELINNYKDVTTEAKKAIKEITMPDYSVTGTGADLVSSVLGLDNLNNTLTAANKQIDDWVKEQRAKAAEARENGVVDETEYQNRLTEITRLAGEQRAQNAKMFAELEAQQRVQIIGAALSQISDFVSTMEQTELEAVGDNEEKKKQIQKKYAVAKAMASIAQIGVDTALGIMSVWSTAGQLGPIAGPIVAGVLTGVIAAMGAVQTAQAVVQANKIKQARRGGLIVGKSHENGGVRLSQNIEVEGGEAILNKRAMAIPQYRALASAMNVSTGGVPLLNHTTPTNAPLSAQIDKSTVSEIVKQTVSAVTSIPVVVSAQTITETQREVNVISRRSSI